MDPIFRETCEEILNWWAPKFGMSHWTFEIKPIKDKNRGIYGRALAANYGYHSAIIYVQENPHPKWLAHFPLEECIVHELLHILGNPLRSHIEVMRDELGADAARVMFTQYNRYDEAQVEALARTLVAVRHDRELGGIVEREDRRGIMSVVEPMFDPDGAQHDCAEPPHPPTAPTGSAHAARRSAAARRFADGAAYGWDAYATDRTFALASGRSVGSISGWLSPADGGGRPTGRSHDAWDAGWIAGWNAHATAADAVDGSPNARRWNALANDGDGTLVDHQPPHQS